VNPTWRENISEEEPSGWGLFKREKRDLGWLKRKGGVVKSEVKKSSNKKGNIPG